ncbi:hypothetical protein R7E49_22520 [Vibrio sp. Vb2110]|uniref:hypothetical protein n=1 Tax=unclassified Vibrio TaxID=2614977 RepID=UPI002964E88B|nr:MULTISPECIES: hypothetical protein [unclassified Vibrio]MDG3412920.1 hypothetical protein [Vibrio parahaemolyticus]MDW1848571.1 hypothetical protein [Vibrio sp. Vb2130]MDW1882687.1 hypothetical protein [Vibrio sp. Vb2110]MDW2040770.1 hypothetical protein [Vibrio sp. 2130-1]MDW2137780.1 hypothetical protein [Vibrio sp. 2128(2023)]
MTFVQDNIELSGLQGGMLILDDGTPETVYYAAATNLATLTVGGVVYPIPSPIPVNHHIVIGELNVDVSVAGYGLLKVPVSGGLTLNRLAITDGAAAKRIEHSPAHLELKGEAHVLGQSIAEINITIDDYSDFNESQTQVGSFVFTSLETLRNGNIPLASELRGMDELSQ